MPEFIPDAQRLTEIFSNAIAPTFFLGAVAAFVSLMSSRLSTVVGRIRTLNGITAEDTTRAYLKVDIEPFRRRARLLKSGILAALRSGVCATLLLAIMFIIGFMGLRHAYGAGWRHHFNCLSRLCTGRARGRIVSLSMTNANDFNSRTLTSGGSPEGIKMTATDQLAHKRCL
jgi:hypothetical protein